MRKYNDGYVFSYIHREMNGVISYYFTLRELIIL